MKRMRGLLIPVLAANAAFALFLLPGLLGAYGPFIDELYYFSCSQRPAWGYVDHPPGAPLLLWCSRQLLGNGLLALRLPAALLGAALVFAIGALARRLGAGQLGQGIACAAALAAPAHQIIFSFFSMNAFEIVLWLAMSWILLEIEQHGGRRWWLVLGLTMGLALQFKHTTAIYGLGLAIGLLASPARRHLRTSGPWLAALLAALFLAPNILWQLGHDWPSLEFYHNADRYKNVPTAIHSGLLLQILFAGPAGLPVWVAGFLFLFRKRGAGDLRLLGWLALSLFLLMLISQKSRPDRIAGIYGLLFAAGGAALEPWLLKRAVWLRWSMAAPFCLMAFALLPFGVPILGPEAFSRYGQFLATPQIEAGAGKQSELPQWFADRLGWPELVQCVEQARARLSPAEREKLVYFAPSYGHAGALEWLGGMAPVFATHNSWYLWGPPTKPVKVAIVLGNDPETLAELFEEVELAGIHHVPYQMPWRNHMPVWIVRRERSPIATHWPGWKDYE